MALRTTIGLLVLITGLSLVSAGCGRYEGTINEECLEPFKLDLGQLDRSLWCSWPHTLKLYVGLTNCTFHVAHRLKCIWPNQIMDSFFIQIHQLYFHDCAPTGRLPRDPPISILGPSIAVPVLVTLLMTSLVVWRSKRSEGIL